MPVEETRVSTVGGSVFFLGATPTGEVGGEVSEEDLDFFRFLFSSSVVPEPVGPLFSEAGVADGFGVSWGVTEVAEEEGAGVLSARAAPTGAIPIMKTMMTTPATFFTRHTPLGK